MAATPPGLKRELGVFGAVMMGMGSIVGTGVFVSIGVAAGIAGPAVILAVALAAVVAACNGLNSAQLAASHAVAGGTYEYGYRYLNPRLGFLAGWMFLLAKSASAATAALGFAGYLLNALGLTTPGLAAWDSRLVATALGVVFVLALVVYSGLRRSNLTNIVIVCVTLLSLAFFVLAGLPSAVAEGAGNLRPFFAPEEGRGWLSTLLEASALMFVAYTGYGRIATMGEEVSEPRRTIPRAIVVTLVLSMGLYMVVAVVGISAVGAGGLGRAAQEAAAPLEVAARAFGIPGAGAVLAVGAMTAMLGVLLNLILGLSRMLLAMGRRRDMPAALASIDPSSHTPRLAVLVIAVVVAALVLTGDVRATWSFSAFTVLLYYAITNLAALRLPEEDRLYPRWLAWLGLGACLFLAFWVDRPIWLLGLGLVAAGLGWQAVARSLARR